jgi:very-short-patch-repair endonuclease
MIILRLKAIQNNANWITMSNKNLITGQHISPEMKARAKMLRREMTPAESRLWHRLHANRLDGYHFRRQQIIDGYIVDFYCHAVGLVVEVDGSIHLEQEAYDQERDAHLRALGLTVLRFYNSDVEREIDAVLEAILHACQAEKGKD